MIADHVTALLPGRPDTARATARQIAFLLEGAMVRSGLEGDGHCLRDARDGGAAAGPGVTVPAGAPRCGTGRDRVLSARRVTVPATGSRDRPGVGRGSVPWWACACAPL